MACNCNGNCKNSNIDKEEEERCIYLVTGMMNLDFIKYEPRSLGFFFNREKAINEVKNNSLDIFEGEYYFVVIERVVNGFYATPIEEIWFKYNRNLDKYYEIEKPEPLKNICNFGIG